MSLKETRILFLMGNNRISGSERGNVQVAKTMRDAGAEVLFYTAPWGHYHFHAYLKQFDLPYVVGKFGGGAHNLRKNFLRLLKFMWLSFWDLRKLCKQYQPTHLHLGAEIYFLELLPFLLFTKTKIVFRLGDKPLNHTVLHRFLWENVYIKRVDQFVCISRFVNKCLLQQAPQNHFRNKPTVILNYPPERNSKHVKRNDLAEDEFVVTYLGLISPHKGIDILIEAAMNILSKRKGIFLIAGQLDENSAYHRTLQERVMKVGLIEKIKFLGFIEDIQSVLKNTDVLAVPSMFEEPLSNVVGEAKANSVPSVVFPSGGLPELVTHLQDGYITSEKTAKALTTGIEYFMDNRELLRKAKSAAYQSLNQLGISKGQFTQDWINVYNLK